ncbi:unnamed protein product [Gordionus sp. m RMFG-2023]
MKIAKKNNNLPVSYVAGDDHVHPKDPTLEEVVKANWKIGLDMYKQISKESPQKSIFFSPYSMTSVLLSLHLGAKGSTASVIESELGLTTITDAHSVAQAKLYQMVLEHKGQYDLVVAKRYYADNSIDLLKPYTDKVEKFFQVKIEKLDFSNTATSAATINKFVSEVTKGKIPNLVPAGLLKSTTKFLAASAITFKGKWNNKFDSVTQGQFKTLTGAAKPQTYMEKTGVFKIGHDASLAAKILELPYLTDHHSAYIVLPDSPTGLTAFEETHLENTVALKTLLASLKPTNAKISIPKFHTTSHYELSSEFKTGGLGDLFTPGTADFSGIDATAVADKLALDYYIQEARLTFDENGGNTPSKDTPINLGASETFKADHSFLYAIICKKTNAPFFIGRFNG